MFNGYNETPLISYNEFTQERLEKKQENVGKWSSYGHETGVQPAQTHPNTRHEFWPGKANFLGVGNVVKCNCTGCYSSDNQSYQGDTTRHRPWLPRTFPVPLNGSNESYKLPAYQWDNGFTSQSPCYSDNNLAYVQENGGKYPYYRAYQNTRIPEPNQPGVITSVKDVEFGKKGKNEMTRRQESPMQNGVFCNPGYNLTKRSYCEVNEKHSNVASHSVDQHLVRLPVVEPFIKAVPSNLSQNRVPSTDYRSVKESMGQSYAYDPRKITETAMNGDKRPESYPTAQPPTGVHIDYSHLNRDLQEEEPQKLYFDNARHPDYYSRNNIQDVIKRNNQTLDNRKDCAMSQMSMSEQHYRSTFYPKDFDKRPENSTCFQDGKTENTNVHVRLPRSAILFSDPSFADRTQNSFPYQSNANAYRNYLRPDYPYQGFNPQDRYEYPGGFQRNEINVPPQQTQNYEQFPPSQQIQGFTYESHLQSSDKMQQFHLGKDPAQTDTLDNRKPNYLESIRSEQINKNGTSKISPLRLLRKKKFISVPQEPTPVNNVDAPPGLDVRKFWSTWADEEEENVTPTQMVVLDCQNIDPEQAKLLHFYETDPVRAVHLDTGNIVIKGVKESSEEVKSCEQTKETKVEESAKPQQEPEKVEENPVPEPVEPKICKKGKSGKKKTEVMDKWTEKKFDFLKRAEESKAAEILRHEEEKKKIFETRLSLQQSLKKSEKSQEKNILSPFDENSHSGTEDGNSDATNLPTCEYRRNKFLDYSEKNVLVNGNLPENVDEIKKEESVKMERSDNSSDMLFKLKEETGFEMDDILKKISEINFEGSEIKLEDSVDKTIRKSKKTKKKKPEQAETDDRTDKLTLETVTKPTIKFSIQKSHDLKISFKVLNSKEDLSGEDPQDKANALEDSKNSTEFTLKYKTFRGDTDSSGLKKKKFRKKKRNSEKMKKSRYEPEVEKDPLGDDDPKPFSDGFQVQETVDSAKIKLTFKRHKGNFETEYKINSNIDDGALDELNNEGAPTEHKSEEIILENNGEEKTLEIMKSSTDIESCPNSPEQISDAENVDKPEEKSRNSPSTEEENYDFETAPPIFAECPSFIPFEVATPENVFEKLEESNPNEETKETDVINCEEMNRSLDRLDSNPEEEISSDFIKSTNSPEIEINHKPVENENADGDINCYSEIKDEMKVGETKTDLLDYENFISDEGVHVEETKITEKTTEDDPERKNSPTGIPKELENLEDFITDDNFLPEREISKPEADDNLFKVEEETVKPEKQVESVNAGPETCLPDDSGIAECSRSTIDVEVETNNPEPELEEGEIIDSSDESGDVEVNRNKKQIEFVCRKIERRHSISKRESQSTETWSRKKFRKAKSCPPGLAFPESSIVDIPVEDIPLPSGPPPLESCWKSKKYKSEAKENSSIFPERVQLTEEPETPSDLEKCRNPSPPTILHRNSKIKFSISKRSKFSKLNLKSPPPPRVKDDSDKPNECQTEEVPKAIVANEKPANDLENVELQLQDLEEDVDPITDLIRDESYECEDIPTSEDLTNGDDLENEKVNDDKFRDIMQNCLDNAKKFLNVGNLKLFSCSVDDLLELDCQPEPSLEITEPEKPTRDVLLTSCGDTEDMGLSENVQPGDISVDVVQTFCSDICPEILPVDNWPYLEEEVTSSPNKPKQDDSDLIPVLENDVLIPDKSNKRVANFRRASDDSFRISSKVNRQRRQTIDSSYGRKMYDFKNADEIKSLKCRLSLDKLMNTTETQNGVSRKSSKNPNYQSPSWQPKVMLLKISKNELRKVLREKHSKKEDDIEQPVLKKPKPESETDEAYVKPEVKNVDNVTAVIDAEGRKRKKLRFRNLHTKRKSKTEVNFRKGVLKPEIVDPEAVLTEIFKNCDSDEKLKRRKDKEDEKQKNRHREKHRSSHERSKSDGKHEKGKSPRWICEVCGFDEPNERIVHIKNHPFHCQSCHLAFKTESHFINHLTKKHKDIRNQHHCLLCELSFDTEEQYQRHLETREHKHLESVEKNTINTLFTILTGAPCPVLGLVDTKPEWLPNQAGTVHFYHQATPLSLALQYLKMHRDLSSFSTASSTHPT